MRLYQIRFSNIQKMLDFYSQFNPSPLSIKQFIDFGKLIYTNICDVFVHFLWRNSSLAC